MVATAGAGECAFSSEYSGDAAGLRGVGGNARREQAMGDTLAFRYVVGSSSFDERTRVLATAGHDVLRLNGATLLAADVRDCSNGPAVDVKLLHQAPRRRSRAVRPSLSARYTSRA